MTDRSEIAKALGEAASQAWQGRRQHPGVWWGLRVYMQKTGMFRDSALTVTVRCGTHEAIAFNAPLSWIQPSQYWRLVDALSKFLGTLPNHGAEARDRADRCQANARAAEGLLGRPFEHTDALNAALEQQRTINDAIQAAADRANDAASDEDVLATAASG